MGKLLPWALVAWIFALVFYGTAVVYQEAYNDARFRLEELLEDYEPDAATEVDSFTLDRLRGILTGVVGYEPGATQEAYDDDAFYRLHRILEGFDPGAEFKSLKAADNAWFAAVRRRHMAQTACMLAWSVCAVLSAIWAVSVRKQSKTSPPVKAPLRMAVWAIGVVLGGILLRECVVEYCGDLTVIQILVPSVLASAIAGLPLWLLYRKTIHPADRRTGPQEG